MKFVAAALVHRALAQTEAPMDWDAPTAYFLHGKCRDLGATPGDTGCEGVVRATSGPAGLVCEGEGHIGDSDPHCDRNAELSVVLSTAQTLLDQVDEADPTAFMTLQTLMNDHCNRATAAEDAPCQEALLQTDGVWKCVKMGGFCESMTDELRAVKWTHEFAVAGHHHVIHCPGGVELPGGCERPMPYCEPPLKRFFNRGQCFADCPDYHEEVDINEEKVCLPTLTREARQLEESTLQAINSGVGNVTLRITYPLLPMNFSEDVTTEFVVDVDPQRDDLNREDKDDACNLKWRRDIRNSTRFYIEGEGDVNDRHKIAFGADREAWEFTSDDVVIQDFTGFPATKKARLTVSLLFKGALDNDWRRGNMDDAIALSVSMDGGSTWTKRETTWPALGQSHAVSPADRKIKRQHVCQWGKGEADRPFEHCEGFFYFLIEDEVDFTNLKVKLEGIEGRSSTAFEWAFAEMQVELPFITTTLSYSDFNGACRLNRAVEVGEHLERSGWVSLALIAIWVGAGGSMMRELQHHVVWPFTARFPTMVGASYLPWTMWETFVGEEVNAEALPWPSLLDLSEDESFDVVKRVPRYEVGSIVYARQCMDEEYDTSDLTLEFRTLCLSNDDDPNAESAFERVLTADVTVLDSRDGCVYISFFHDQPCEWCTLHMWSIVKPIATTPPADADATPADADATSADADATSADADATPPGNRRLTKQHEEDLVSKGEGNGRSLSGHTEKEEVESQPSEREGWARSSLTGFYFDVANSGVEVREADTEDSGARRPVTMSLALAIPAWFLVQ